MNFQLLERELTAYFAEKLDLVVDKSIFRGKIPVSVEHGAAVRIESNPENNDLSLPSFSVQILGKYKERDDAWALVTKCAELAPVYGEQTEHFALVYIHTEGGINAPFEAENQGRQFQFVSVNLSVGVLTRSA